MGSVNNMKIKSLTLSPFSFVFQATLVSFLVELQSNDVVDEEHLFTTMTRSVHGVAVKQFSPTSNPMLCITSCSTSLNYILRPIQFQKSHKMNSELIILTILTC